MTKHRKRYFKKVTSPGAAPGLLHAPQDAASTSIAVMSFDENKLVEKELKAVKDITPYLQKYPLTWINVTGLGSVDVIEEIGDLLSLHPLALEDVMNTHHRPKTEDFDEYLFVIMRMALIDHDDDLDIEQISMFVGKNYVLTFQERHGDCLEPVRNRIRKGGKRIRMSHSDYLAYAIMDAIVDGYFPVLEHYGDILNDLEDIVVGNPEKDMLERSHDIKRDLRLLRHACWPMRETANGFSDDNSKIVREEIRAYIRDCYDHIIQVLDILETYRERASGLTDIYLSSVSNKMNEVMKVLTIIATIFMPLGFITGLYGMNFNPDVSPYNMPELSWRYGYPYALSLMVLFLVGFITYFIRSGWVGRPKIFSKKKNKK